MLRVKRRSPDIEASGPLSEGVVRTAHVTSPRAAATATVPKIFRFPNISISSYEAVLKGVGVGHLQQFAMRPSRQGGPSQQGDFMDPTTV